MDTDSASVSVELTLTGILAAAHLRGAYGTLNSLLGAAVSTDEYGTSILQYIDHFGGYYSPSAGDMIAFLTTARPAKEGLGAPGEADGGDAGGGAVGTVSIDTGIAEFNPQST